MTVPGGPQEESEAAGSETSIDASQDAHAGGAAGQDPHLPQDALRPVAPQIVRPSGGRHPSKAGQGFRVGQG